MDDRFIWGYNGYYQKHHTVLNKPVVGTLGLSSRADFTQVSLLNSTRRTEISPIIQGKVNQINTAIYYNADWKWSRQWGLNTGARLDYFSFMFKPIAEEVKHKNKFILNAKFNLFYQPHSSIKFFAKSGIGFHSNDTRAVVQERLENSLPKAVGYEIGVEAKIDEGLHLNIAAWSLHSQSELIYVGDEGVIETNSPTQRIGIDISTRYQWSRYFVADLDLNLSRGRLQNAVEGSDHLPLAPQVTSTGGLLFVRPQGFNASLRYKLMSDRPANEDYSIKAKGYMIWDLTMKYIHSKFEYFISVENLLNANWNQAQFATTSRLFYEPQSVSELHFTPGTPRYIKASVGYKF